ncbi:NAD-dependent epimerase/dehydratase family protein [Mucilaginibacter sp. SP1R1]|uniref:NAD-dependent epimerase/dehydratase family protein n=1 Tax=Mucilaginibacter sp. SP1R1 TaxID=2723091 RepID=UPI00161F248E|nr:SDR family oxidoreductase [Mucilaginibacter sp. SP1R1]MBB6149561.1 UDP-glucose 4-epimerase [Mucilaginibacter sp. SP1R1]
MSAEESKKKVVLITGAYGFLGRHAAKNFSDEGYRVIGIGHGKWQSYEYNKWGIDEWNESTITFEALINLNRTFDVIVHCGGSGSVAFSYQNPYEDFQKSVQSTLSLLEYIRLQAKPCHFIYPSSPAVHGDLGDKEIIEDDPSFPISPYGFHKKAAEELCLSYHKNFNIKVSIIRYFSIYGAGLQKQLLWDACLKIKNSEKEITFFGTGDETRDWIYVTDATSLILAIAKNVKADMIIINGGTGVRTTISNTINELVRLYGKNNVVTFNKQVKPGDPRFYHADISKAKALGWEPSISLSEGLMKYLIYFKNLMND